MKNIILIIMLLLFIRCNNNHIVNDSTIENKELISVIKRFINETKNTQTYSDSKFIELSLFEDEYVHIEYIVPFEYCKIFSAGIICQKINGKRILIRQPLCYSIAANFEKRLELIRSEYPDYKGNTGDTVKEGYITPCLTCEFDDNMKLIDSTYNLMFLTTIYPMLK